MDPIVIVGAARTPQGNFLGAFKELTAPELGKIAIEAALQKASLSGADISEVFMGCVLQAGIGQAPARQAAIKAQLPPTVPCTTINKMCGSGMKAVMLAHDSIVAGSGHIYVAGGMESMSNAPYLVPKARQGYRLGHGQLLDHMMLDGLEDAYQSGKAMGYFAELCAQKYHFDRNTQDQYAIESLKRAQAAAKGKFADEIAPVNIPTRNGEQIISTDERPGSVNMDKIPQLLPAFLPNGSVTAANSSSISDGAAALILMKLSEAERRGLKPLAKIIGHAGIAKSPEEFTTAPIDAISKLLKQIRWEINQVDLFEINEAFAVVTLAAMKDLSIPHAKLNIHGGGCALGHPIGASGARIIVTLLSALKHYQLKRGIASLCIGGGEATAIALETYS